MRRSWIALTVLGITCLLLALSLVSWRQTRVRAVLAEVAELQRQVSLGEAERNELARNIQFLESRSRVIREAEARLGLRRAMAHETVWFIDDERQVEP